MTRVSPEELEYSVDGRYYHEGTLFTGVIVYSRSDGWVEAEEEYQDGLLFGMKREWHARGILSREAQCAWGARHGMCIEWDENGRLIAETSYEYGVRVSGKRWNSEGDLTEEFRIEESDPGFQVLQAARAAHRSAES